jgi:hypothetical protein
MEVRRRHNANPANDNVLDASTLERATLTDQNGAYVFVVTPGAFIVREVQRPGWEQVFPASPGFHAVVVPEPPRSFAPLDFANFELGAISGHKFLDLDANGLRDAGEPGLSGWSVLLNPVDTDGDGRFEGGARAAVTDADGRYEFRGLAAGDYTVGEQLQAGWRQTAPTLVPPGIHTVHVAGTTSGERYQDRDFGNVELGSIAGTKFEDHNGNGARDDQDQGLADWTIFLDANGSGVLDPGEVSTTTDAQGLRVFGAGAGHVPRGRGPPGGLEADDPHRSRLHRAADQRAGRRRARLRQPPVERHRGHHVRGPQRQRPTGRRGPGAAGLDDLPRSERKRRPRCRGERAHRELG